MKHPAFIFLTLPCFQPPVSPSPLFCAAVWCVFGQLHSGDGEERQRRGCVGVSGRAGNGARGVWLRRAHRNYSSAGIAGWRKGRKMADVSVWRGQSAHRGREQRGHGHELSRLLQKGRRVRCAASESDRHGKKKVPQDTPLRRPAGCGSLFRVASIEELSRKCSQCVFGSCVWETCLCLCCNV